jgi:alkylation response protein AidB-like acyl-CoA dehydrogenase
MGFQRTPARRIALDVTDDDLLNRLDQVEQIAVAADQVGVARRSLEQGVDYARQRSQFGRPIGSFQAVQHPFADIALAIECAWAATYEAAWCADHRRDDVARLAALAAGVAGDAALAAAEITLQVFGGVGFTWDNPAHLYLKRAKANRLLWGQPAAHRRRLADLLEL